MTTSQLNSAIKKLSSEIYHRSFGDVNEYNNYIQNEAKSEYLRLYNADNTLKSMTKDSLLRMIRMNNCHRFIPIHTFGLFINLI